MSFRMLLIVKAVVCLVFGVILLAAPKSLLGVLGAELGPAGMFTAREYGSALIGAMLLTWFARETKAADARCAILLYLLVYDAIAMLVSIEATLTGVLNVLGWGIVAVYAFFALASGWVMLREKPCRHPAA